MSEPIPDQPNHLTVSIPESVAGGHFADFASIWHTRDLFVFDFACIAAPPAAAVSPEGEQVTLTQCQAVTRVRVLPAQVIEIMKALGNQLDAWEQETGVKPPTGM